MRRSNSRKKSVALARLANWKWFVQVKKQTKQKKKNLDSPGFRLQLQQLVFPARGCFGEEVGGRERGGGPVSLCEGSPQGRFDAIRTELMTSKNCFQLLNIKLKKEKKKKSSARVANAARVAPHTHAAHCYRFEAFYRQHLQTRTKTRLSRGASEWSSETETISNSPTTRWSMLQLELGLTCLLKNRNYPFWWPEMMSRNKLQWEHKPGILWDWSLGWTQLTKRCQSDLGFENTNKWHKKKHPLIKITTDHS